MKSKLKVCAAVILALAVHRVAQADILIGQTAGFTGQAAPSVQAMTTGAKLIIDAVNAQGGIHGEQIRLMSVDDGNDVKRATENADRLIKKERVLALFLTRGTPHTEAMLPLLAEYGVPLLAPSTGAMSLHKPVVREVFNVRPTYQYEAEKLVSQLAAMSVGDKIGVVYSDDGFGKDVLEGLRRGFEAIKAKPVFEMKYERSADNIDTAFDAVQKFKADRGEYPALVVIGTARPTTALVKRLRSAGVNNYVATMSTNASHGFIEGLGEHARFVIVSQAFPSERAQHVPIVKKITGLLEAAGSTQPPSPALLEGAVAAEVLVEALRRCDKPCSSSKLIATLESRRPFVTGIQGQEIVYSKMEHSGIRYTDTSIIIDGKFRR